MLLLRIDLIPNAGSVVTMSSTYSTPHTSMRGKRIPDHTHLHSSSHRRRGSMGMTRCTRYTLVLRFPASKSRALQDTNIKGSAVLLM
jgi:hypothetical protein